MALFQVTGLRVNGVRPLDFALDRGGVLTLTGPSGVGKTRLLRAMADLEPHEGEIRLHGKVMADLPPTEWRRRVALVPTESAWWLPRVAEHFPAWPPPALDTLALTPGFGDRPVERLSSGERQRLALLRALVNDPDVLLLDEATANLDAPNAERVGTVLDSLRRDRGLALVRVAHRDDGAGGEVIEVRPE